MQRCGSSRGKGAGWPIFLAWTGLNCQTDLVHSRKSSFWMVFSRSSLGRLKTSLLKTRIYSWTSLRTGLLAEHQLPQAVEGLALAALSQMISPSIRYPMESICLMMSECNGR